MSPARKRSKQKNGRRVTHRESFSGTLQVTAGGYGFVQTPEGEFFIPRSKTQGAMDGDLVEITRMVRERSSLKQKHKQQAKSEGRIVRVIERAHISLIGRYEDNGTFGFVVPDDPRIGFDMFIDPSMGLRAVDGDIVSARIITYPSRHEVCVGMIEEIIGHSGDKGLDSALVIARHGFETSFSAGSLEQAEGTRLDIERGLQERDRRDIRGRMICTIDPVDARDFDDALSLERVEGMLCLGVHIADVSSYVPWGSSIDLDARRRATSVYLADRVIPMLPEQLSCNLCSLRPREERLAFTVDLYMRNDGSLAKVDMYPSVIRSRLRLDYDALEKTFEGKQDYTRLFADACSKGDTAEDFDEHEAVRTFEDLRVVAQRLRHMRISRGALDFETVEVKVDLDENNDPMGIRLRHRNEATDLVEECMIAANEAVAHYMLEQEAPCVYRIHEEPLSHSLEDIAPVLYEFGYSGENEIVDASGIRRILDEAKDTPEEELIDALLLRAMKRAVYSDHFTTHFGLASKGYTHFTSPIRRYPDLLVHRLLRAQLLNIADSKAPEETPSALMNVAEIPGQLAWLCEHSSIMEREAEMASLESTRYNVCVYMQRFVGEEFDATITSVMGFGMFVRIDLGAEGLVKRECLPEDLIFDAPRRAFVSEKGSIVYRLAQRVRVHLVEVVPEKFQMDFTLV